MKWPGDEAERESSEREREREREMCERREGKKRENDGEERD